MKHHLRHFLVFVVPPAARPEDQPEGLRPEVPRPEVVRPQVPRLGITVTRKVGDATVRNRIKRYVREAFRRKRGSFTPGYDMVWVAKQSAATIGYADVVAAMDALGKRPPLGAAC